MEQQQKQQKGANLIQIISVGFAIIAAIGGVWMNTITRITQLEIGTNLKLEDMRKDVDYNTGKYECIQKDLVKILIILENKQNKD